jgi:hypothetical protein
VRDKDRELTLEELEFVRGGLDYHGQKRYRAEIINLYKLKYEDSDYLEICMNIKQNC